MYDVRGAFWTRCETDILVTTECAHGKTEHKGNYYYDDRDYRIVRVYSNGQLMNESYMDR
jgi:hypothetical protein